jgi:hypothetical protein
VIAEIVLERLPEVESGYVSIVDQFWTRAHRLKLRKRSQINKIKQPKAAERWSTFFLSSSSSKHSDHQSKQQQQSEGRDATG